MSQVFNYVSIIKTERCISNELFTDKEATFFNIKNYF